MAKPINCPQVGQDIETAILVAWRVKAGEEIRKGDVIAEVESDKATFEVEAFASGTVVELLYEEGDEVKVLKPIAYIGESEEEVSKGETESTGNGEVKQPEPSPKHEVSNTREPTIAPKDRVFASPSARRIARKYDIDIASINGSGPRGRVIKRDVME
ncbi:MAG TPA: biotin/lipoyl-containing protein, partial [bacterium]|nr:biotin/lipoyl-containing protein [bacterium]